VDHPRPHTAHTNSHTRTQTHTRAHKLIHAHVDYSRHLNTQTKRALTPPTHTHARGLLLKKKWAISLRRSRSLLRTSSCRRESCPQPAVLCRARAPTRFRMRVMTKTWNFATLISSMSETLPRLARMNTKPRWVDGTAALPTMVALRIRPEVCLRFTFSLVVSTSLQLPFQLPFQFQLPFLLPLQLPFLLPPVFLIPLFLFPTGSS
jgi:hypothetical protein